jgi:uncharacterized protein YmfQ (DUF2313 family)
MITGEMYQIFSMSTETIIERLEVLEHKLNSDGAYVRRFYVRARHRAPWELNAAWRPA